MYIHFKNKHNQQRQSSLTCTNKNMDNSSRSISVSRKDDKETMSREPNYRGIKAMPYIVGNDNRHSNNLYLCNLVDTAIFP